MGKVNLDVKTDKTKTNIVRAYGAQSNKQKTKYIEAANLYLLKIISWNHKWYLYLYQSSFT